MEIAGKVFAITGAAQGLGLAAATHLASKGANLALLDVNESKLQGAVEACLQASKDFDNEVRNYEVNVADELAVTTTFDHIVDDYSALHGLINNAGITRDALLLKVTDGKVKSRMSLDHWQAVIDVNLTGVFLCGREAATKMVESDSGGVIVNIASISKAGNIGQTNYSAAKSGVEAMTVTWAQELSRYGIRCVAIAPGFTETDMVASMKPEALHIMAQRIPLRRLGSPKHIASTIAFAIENEYISGRTIEVDGGLRF